MGAPSLSCLASRLTDASRTTPHVPRFLTQTRPEGSSPLVYRPSPSQRPYDALLRSHSDGVLGAAPAGMGNAASSPLVTRRPLSTLAETSPTSSPVRREPLRRLR